MPVAGGHLLVAHRHQRAGGALDGRRVRADRARRPTASTSASRRATRRRRSTPASPRRRWRDDDRGGHRGRQPPAVRAGIPAVGERDLQLADDASASTASSPASTSTSAAATRRSRDQAGWHSEPLTRIDPARFGDRRPDHHDRSPSTRCCRPTTSATCGSACAATTGRRHSSSTTSPTRTHCSASTRSVAASRVSATWSTSRGPTASRSARTSVVRPSRWPRRRRRRRRRRRPRRRHPRRRPGRPGQGWCHGRQGPLPELRRLGVVVDEIGCFREVTLRGLLFDSDSSAVSADDGAASTRQSRSTRRCRTTSRRRPASRSKATPTARVRRPTTRSLSERRANAVKAYVVRQGVNPAQITTVGKGESSRSTTTTRGRTPEQPPRRDPRDALTGRP